MTKPDPKTLTSAPLRHRLCLELQATVPAVWAVVGSHERLPEYSEGIERVEVEHAGMRVCHFRPRNGVAIVLRELIRWEEANVGYSASAEEGNDFGLRDDLSLVTLSASEIGTILIWDQYYNHDDLPMMRAGFAEGLADIGRRLVTRFGGRVVEEHVDGPVAVPM